MKAHIITIGDELLIGQVIDTNSAWIAQQMNALGIFVEQRTSVGDTLPQIIEAVQRAGTQAQLVLITGGLGPTKDDITKKALCTFFDTHLVFHEPTYLRLVHYFERIGRTLNDTFLEGLRQQALLPANCTQLTNNVGTASGMWFEKDNTIYISMPGVPFEMKHIVENEVIPRLQKNSALQPIVHRTLLTAGVGETQLAKELEHFEHNLPHNIKLAYLPDIAAVRLRLTARGEADTHHTLQQVVDDQTAQMRQLVNQYVFGTENDTLESVIGQILVERGYTMATAESCTGGYIAHKITAQTGASAYFKGATVAYSNEIKTQILGVQQSTLDTYGAVSEQTVTAMLRGILRLYGANVGIAISGIAGPGGGTPEKPVGTCWVAVGDINHQRTLYLQVGPRDRQINIQAFTTLALNALRKFLLDNKE
jgi:nicotinamide-nucleotide amidase